ncbi:hypothetical protein ACFSCX_15585 [Bacillus salitolerans]|uniref:Uncharacterized protein n=1 Tax=Bacillus salitolerans TaxID=1437434 RepID=A0ABW4LSC1_9BACI
MDGFWIGIIFVVVAIVSIFFKKNNQSKMNNRLFTFIGLLAFIIGIIGYVFLNWRF